MAYQATMHADYWDHDNPGLGQEAANGLKVSNHSYGEPVGWENGDFGMGQGWYWFGDPLQQEDYKLGFYNDDAAYFDDVTFDAQYILPVNSAGNDHLYGPGIWPHWHPDPKTGLWIQANDYHLPDGGPSGYDGLSDRGVAKNTLTIGAVEDIPFGYSQPSDVIIWGGTDFGSNWGPTDDGRIKPDVVANGTYLTTTDSDTDIDYNNGTGTSFASPSVAGSIALLLQHQNNLHPNIPLCASTLKALVIHTADEAGTDPGPDYIYGWGLMNTSKAAEVMTNNAQTPNKIFKATLYNQSQLQYSITSNAQPIRVTICWTDPAANVPGIALNNTTPMLINDIDVKIIGPGGTTYYPWVLQGLINPSAPATTGINHVDNVEQILIQSPQQGAVYTVVIDHSGQLTGGSQIVSIIITPGADCTLSAHAGIDKEFCSGTGGVTIGENATGGTPPYSYSWNPTGGLSDPNIAQPIANPTSTTTYTVTVTDAAQCQSGDEVLVTVNPLPVANAGQDKAICFGASTIIGQPTSGGTPPYTYSWTPTTELNDPTIEQPNASPSSTTIYSLTVTDSKGCHHTDDVVVTVHHVIANAGQVVTISQGGSAQIGELATGGTPPYTYIWSPTTGLSDPTISQPIASPTTTTIYSVTVTDANGCSSSDATAVVVTGSPEITITPLTLYFTAEETGPTPDAQNVMLATTPDGLNWSETITQGNLWLSCSPNNGTGFTKNITSSITNTNISPTTYNGNIRFQGPTDYTDLPVTYELVPRVQISPQSNPVVFRFGCKSTSSGTKSITINNAGGHFGGGQLSWNASTTASEIQLIQSSGVEGQSLVFSVDPSSLPDGTHYRTITITGQNSVTGILASNTPYTLNVQIEKEPDTPVSQTLSVGTGSYTQFTNSYGHVIAEVQSHSGTLTFTVNMTPCTYPNGMTRLRYVKRYYTLSSVPSLPTVDLKLYYTSSELVSITDPSALKIYQQYPAGGIWYDRGGTSEPDLYRVTTLNQINIDGVWAMAHYWVPKAAEINISDSYYDKKTESAVIKWKSSIIPLSEGFIVERQEGIDQFSSEWMFAGNVVYDNSEEYLFSEKLLSQGKYLYRIRVTDVDGFEHISESIELMRSSTPDDFSLEQNFPEPFSDWSAIRFNILVQGFVSLKIFDVLGREVAMLYNSEMNAGKHEISFSGRNLLKGTYFYQLSVSGQTLTKIMHVM